MVEFLFVMTLSVILAATGLYLYNSSQERQALRLTAQGMTSALAEARHNATLGLNASRHGVYINAVQGYFVLFQGSSFETKSANFNQTSTWPVNVVSYSGPAEIIFEAVSGTTAAASLVFQNRDKNITIAIDQSGQIQ